MLEWAWGELCGKRWRREERKEGKEERGIRYVMVIFVYGNC